MVRRTIVVVGLLFGSAVPAGPTGGRAVSVDLPIPPATTGSCTSSRSSRTTTGPGARGISTRRLVRP
jgi:hypothetical protein